MLAKALKQAKTSHPLATKLLNISTQLACKPQRKSA